MRTCPVCKERGVGLTALLSAAFGSNSHCAACASGLKFNRVKDVIATLAFAVGLLAAIKLQSIFAGVLIRAVSWTAVLLTPLIPEIDDPAAFRKELRNARQTNRR